MTTEIKRVLLAEDDARDAELTITALRPSGMGNQLIHVQDGAEALDYLLRRGKFSNRPGGNPALVLLDLKMPKVDGLQALRAIRADEHLRLIPVVILTSSREEKDLVESYKLGANAYVVKPVHFEEFLRAVKELGMFWILINQAPPSAP